MQRRSRRDLPGSGLEKVLKLSLQSQQGCPALDSPVWGQPIKLTHQPCCGVILRDVSGQVVTASVVLSYGRAQRFHPQPDLGLRKAPLVWGHEPTW